MEYRSEIVGGAEIATIIHDGREYTALGSTMTPDRAVGYLKCGESHQITTWNGETLGYTQIVASWQTSRSEVSSRMYQIRANINGIWYTGRCAGDGTLWRGKRCAYQG